MAIKTDGTLWTWDSDSNGQMGNGAAVLGHSVLTQVGTTINWAQIDAGKYHVIALNTGGGVFTWGKGGEGQLGNGLGNDLSTPFLISGTAGVLKIDANARGSVIILSDNSLWTSGLVGTSSSFNFARFQTANNWSNVSIGYSHVLATKLDGTLWAWGDNSLLQCSNSGGGQFGNPIQVAGGSTYSNAINTNLYGSNALKNDGSLHSFGQNHVGQLALGNLTNPLISAVSCPTTLSNDSFEKENEISVYPNPVLNVLNIEGQLEIEKIIIYDITGRQIKFQNGSEKLIVVDDLNAGLYCVEIINRNKSIYRKILKK